MCRSWFLKYFSPYFPCSWTHKHVLRCQAGEVAFEVESKEINDAIISHNAMEFSKTLEEHRFHLTIQPSTQVRKWLTSMSVWKISQWFETASQKMVEFWLHISNTQRMFTYKCQKKCQIRTGGVASMVEYELCIREALGSIPSPAPPLQRSHMLPMIKWINSQTSNEWLN